MEPTVKGSEFSFDGPVLASTWRDSRDGNTVGDDRKSSKFSKCKNIYFQVFRSWFRPKRRIIRNRCL